MEVGIIGKGFVYSEKVKELKKTRKEGQKVYSGKSNRKCFIRTISLCLVVFFAAFSIIQPETSLANKFTSIGQHLATQGMGVDGIDRSLELRVSEAGMLESTVIRKIRKNPEVLFQPEDPSNNLFSKLMHGKPVTAYFSRSKRLDIKGVFEDKDIRGIFLIPSRVGENPYLLHVTYYNDGKLKCHVYEEKDVGPYFRELADEEILTEEEADELKDRLFEECQKQEGEIYFVDSTDEAVQAVKVFLEMIGAKFSGRNLQEITEAGRLRLPEDPKAEGIDVAAYQDNEKTRAEYILKGMLSLIHHDYNMALKPFQVFWKLWKKDEEGTFDIDEVDYDLKVSVIQAEEGMDKKEGSNEGGMRFASHAYSNMPYLKAYKLEDCQETVDEFLRILREVAVHELPPDLKRQYELFSMNQDLDELVSEDRFEEAARLRDKMRALEGEMGILPDDRDENLRKYEKIFDSIPGLNPDNIKFTNISDGMLPTDIITRPNGRTIVRVNENFIKIMQHMSKKGLKGQSCKVTAVDVLRDFRRYNFENPRVEYGDLYESIIYSIAIHTVRGHFSIRENGVARFETSEERAQSQRGRRLGYNNILAMSFYWVVILEAEEGQVPGERLKVFMENNPEVYKELTPEERETMPLHLSALFVQLAREGNLQFFPFKMMETGMTAKDVEQIFKKYPNSASNEGKAQQEEDWDLKANREKNRDFWAHAVVDIFLSGEGAKKRIETGQKKMLILGTDWIKDKQLMLLQPLIQKLKQLGDEGAVNVVWQRPGESDEDFASRAITEKSKLKVKVKDVVIMGSVKTVSQTVFDGMRGRDDEDENSAFFIGVDGKKLESDSFVRLLEMVTLAMRMASGHTPSGHPQIRVGKVGFRSALFILIPDAEKIDPKEAIENPYEGQLRIIKAA